MKNLLSVAVFFLTAIFLTSLSSCSAQAPKANLKTSIDSLSYAYGISFTQNIDQYLLQMEIEDSEKDEFIKGFTEGAKINKDDKKAWAHALGREVGRQLAFDVFNNINESLFGPEATATESMNKSQYIAGFIAAMMKQNTLIKQEEAYMFTQIKGEEIKTKANEKMKAENQAFLDSNKSKEGVIDLPSGLQYKVVKEGNGPKPAAVDTVVVNYTLSNIHGMKLQSNDSIKFPLNGVISGWTEGIQLMSPGAKYFLYVPYNLGYGEQGQAPDITPYATLVFEVDLLEIIKK